ncbi:MAG: glucose-1-phosphate adenylyltransferase subunit GlgD [Firmicutes bacterium]|nr:glucose-1-phosphate adenylyltransferase subunit GlgD [Bacillota bacterium]
MANVLGIISYNDSNVYVEGLQEERPIAAFNFLGRYRLIDFPISNMTNSGIDEVQIYTTGNIRPLIKHIGSGRQYNVNSKNGDIRLLPTYTKSSRIAPDIEAFSQSLEEIEGNKNEYVVVAPTNMVYICNYNDLVAQHIESGADISILSKKVSGANEQYIGCQILAADKTDVKGIAINDGAKKSALLSLETYVMKKDLLVQAIKDAKATSSMYWLKDIINDYCETKAVKAIPQRGNVYCIYNLESYVNANLDILDASKMKDFAKPSWPIYTRTKDSAPAIYSKTGSAVTSLVSNGAKISGKVVGSVVGRGVVIGKGAIVENCVIMPEVEIADGAILKNVVVDKFAKISKKTDIVSEDDLPVYIGRGEKV